MCMYLLLIIQQWQMQKLKKWMKTFYDFIMRLLVIYNDENIRPLGTHFVNFWINTDTTMFRLTLEWRNNEFHILKLFYLNCSMWFHLCRSFSVIEQSNMSLCRWQNVWSCLNLMRCHQKNRPPPPFRKKKDFVFKHRGLHLLLESYLENSDTGINRGLMI